MDEAMVEMIDAANAHYSDVVDALREAAAVLSKVAFDPGARKLKAETGALILKAFTDIDAVLYDVDFGE